jgi:hypothetical protein
LCHDVGLASGHLGKRDNPPPKPPITPISLLKETKPRLMENLIGSRSPIRGDIADPYYSGEVIGRIAAVIGKQPISRGAYLKVKRSSRKALIDSMSSLRGSKRKLLKK